MNDLVAFLAFLISVVAPIIAVVFQVYDLSHPPEFWVVVTALWAWSWGFWAGAVLQDREQRLKMRKW